MSFLECEIAVTPARASLSIETTTLFLVRGQHSCLELRDCALSGIRAPQDKVTAVEVEPQPAEVGECTSVVCVRSCSLSHFAHAIVAQDNTIVKVERSHFQRTRGSALSARSWASQASGGCSRSQWASTPPRGSTETQSTASAGTDRVVAPPAAPGRRQPDRTHQR